MKKYIFIIIATVLMTYGCSQTGSPTAATTSAITANPYPAPSPTPEMKNFLQGDRYCDFSDRCSFGAAAANGSLYVIAGRGVSGCTNDTWLTQDCEYWVSLTAKAVFGARELFNTEVYDNKIFITGGVNNKHYCNDTWVLSGTTWTAVNAASPYEARAAAASTVLKDSLILAGGTDGKTVFNDVWSLNLHDPKAWVKLKDNSGKGFTPRSGHGALNFSGKLWVLGGSLDNGKPSNDVWNSENGVDWKIVTPTAGFCPRKNFESFVYKDRMWVIGGINVSGTPESDIWWSVNGYYWVSTTAKTGFGGRSGAAVAQYQGKVWVIAGQSNDKLERDIWSGQ
jgi:hypothetical protein